MERGGSTRASTPAWTRWSPPGAAEEVRRADAAGAARTARSALGFEELLARRPGGHEAPHAQLREAPARPGCAAFPACTRSTSARAAPPTPPQRIAHILAARPGSAASHQRRRRICDSRDRARRRRGRPCGLCAFRLCRARLLEHRAQHHPVRSVGSDSEPQRHAHPGPGIAAGAPLRRPHAALRQDLERRPQQLLQVREARHEGPGPAPPRARPAQGRAPHPRPLQRAAHLRQDRTTT